MRTLLIIFLAVSVLACNSVTNDKQGSSTDTTTISKTTVTSEKIKDTVVAAKQEPVNTTDTLFGTSKHKAILSVTVLPTSDGVLEDSEVNAFKYPDSVAIDSEPEWNGKIAAFGAAYEVWLAPVGWTGNGRAGADGGKVIELFPPGGDSLTGAYVSFYEEPACVGCILSNAGEYFADARKAYNENYNDDGASPIKIPAGLKVARISSKIVTYTLPVKNGLTIHGIAIYRGEEDYFEAKFVFPEEQSVMRDHLLNHYLSWLKSVQ